MIFRSSRYSPPRSLLWYTLTILIVLAPARLLAQGVDTEYKKARALIEAGAFDRAEEILRECITHDPGALLCQIELALTLETALGEYAEALPIARRAVDLTDSDHSPQDQDSRTIRGMAYAAYGIALINTGDIELAHDFLESAIELLPPTHYLRPLLAAPLRDARNLERTLREWDTSYRDRIARSLITLEGGHHQVSNRPDPALAGYRTAGNLYQWTAYPIDLVGEVEGRGYLVILRLGPYDQIWAGQEGPVYAISRDGEGAAPLAAIGTATVVENREGELLVLVRPSPIGAGLYPLREGDLVFLPSAYLWDDAPSVMLSLARLHIGLTGGGEGEDEILLSIEDLRLLDLPIPPEVALGRIAREIRDAAAWLHEWIDEYPTLDLPLTHGPYAGRTALEVMERTSNHDVVLFLHALEADHQRYMGYYWQTTDLYTQWLNGWLDTM